MYVRCVYLRDIYFFSPRWICTSLIYVLRLVSIKRSGDFCENPMVSFFSITNYVIMVVDGKINCGVTSIAIRTTQSTYDTCHIFKLSNVLIKKFNGNVTLFNHSPKWIINQFISIVKCHILHSCLKRTVIALTSKRV